MIILIGKTASGKDTILNKLVKDYGFKKMVTYTTRPMRPGEIQGETYHFVTDEEFQRLVKDGFFLEYKEYHTNQGTWYYGSAASDFKGDTLYKIVILTPDGYRDYLEKNPDEIHISLYISADNDVILQRLRQRGDDEEEIKRRMEHDDKDFEGVEDLVHGVITNNYNKKLSLTYIVFRIATLYSETICKVKFENIPTRKVLYNINAKV